jgi:hypothetical protein
MGTDASTIVPAVVGILTALGGGVAWWIKRTDNAKDPLPKLTAEQMLQERAVQMAGGISLRLEAEVERISRDLDRERVRGDRQQNELDALRQDNTRLHDKVGLIMVRLSDAARYIEALLRWANAGSPPPPPALPDELRDLIDPSLHTGDNTQEAHRGDP